MFGKKAFFVILVSLVISSFLPSYGCTIWGAAGNVTEKGDTIVAKNRDWRPNQYNELWLIDPQDGYRFIAVYSIGGDNEGVKAGINEKGFTVIFASASCLPKEDRFGGETSLIVKLLTRCDNVHMAVEQKELLSKSRAGFYIFGDKNEIACVEIAPGGEVSINEVEAGFLYHTNHYLNENFVKFNKEENESSSVRAERIKYLLNNQSDVFTVKDFIKFSEDKNDGPDNSIWRTGSSPEKTRTLSSWIVRIPKNGEPFLYVKLANPGEDEKFYELKLDENFWINSKL